MVPACDESILTDVECVARQFYIHSVIVLQFSSRDKWPIWPGSFWAEWEHAEADLSDQRNTSNNILLSEYRSRRLGYNRVEQMDSSLGYARTSFIRHLDWLDQLTV